MSLHFCLNEGKVRGMATNKSKSVIIALMLLVPTLFGIEPVLAQDKKMAVKEERQRFELFANCQPLYLLVESLPEHANRIGLKKIDIILAAESRLRSARIYTDRVLAPVLYINVNVVGLAYNVSFELKKIVYDALSGKTGDATTWVISATGTHGQHKDAILNAVDDFMDLFILEFLRANDKACEQK